VFRERHAQAEQYAPDDGGQRQMLEAGPVRSEEAAMKASVFRPNSEVGFRWQVVDDFMFRGTYAEGFRAPSIGKLFGTAARFDAQLQDPCNEATGQRGANCAILGVPNPATYTQSNSQISVLTGGNQNLQPERRPGRTRPSVQSTARTGVKAPRVIAVSLPPRTQAIAACAALPAGARALPAAGDRKPGAAASTAFPRKCSSSPGYGRLRGAAASSGRSPENA
jgi:TonB-dependent receptor-like protein